MSEALRAFPPILKKRRIMGRTRRRNLLAFVAFTSPWIVGYALFTVGPMVATFVLSFARYNIRQTIQVQMSLPHILIITQSVDVY